MATPVSRAPIVGQYALLHRGSAALCRDDLQRRRARQFQELAILMGVFLARSGQLIRQAAAALQRPNREPQPKSGAEVPPGDAAAVDQQSQTRMLPPGQGNRQAGEPAGFRAPFTAFDEGEMAVMPFQDRRAASGQHAAGQHADQRRWLRQFRAGGPEQGHHAAIRAAADERQAEGCRRPRHARQPRSGQRFMLRGDAASAATDEKRRARVNETEAPQDRRRVSSDKQWTRGRRAIPWGGVSLAIRPVYRAGANLRRIERCGKPGGERLWLYCAHG